MIVIESNPVTNLQIDSFFKFFAGLEEWKPLGFDRHFFTSLGISAVEAFVVLDKEAA